MSKKFWEGVIFIVSLGVVFGRALFWEWSFYYGN